MFMMLVDVITVVGFLVTTLFVLAIASLHVVLRRSQVVVMWAFLDFQLFLQVISVICGLFLFFTFEHAVG
jgi:hypothetical protein